MGFFNFLNSKWFSSRYKMPVHIVQLVLIGIAMGCSAPRLFMKNQPRTRANTIALGMGAKSLIVIGYQIISERVRSCQKWRSYKAYAILNGLEIVFWGSVIFLVMQANLKSCKGTTCYLSWAVVGASVMMNQLCVYMFLITFREFRDHKQGRRDFEKSRSANSQQMHLPTYAQRPKPTEPTYGHQEQGRVETGYNGYVAAPRSSRS